MPITVEVSGRMVDVLLTVHQPCVVDIWKLQYCRLLADAGGLYAGSNLPQFYPALLRLTVRYSNLSLTVLNIFLRGALLSLRSVLAPLHRQTLKTL